MKIKIYKECTIQKDKFLKFLGIDLFIIPTIKIYYELSKVEKESPKFEIYFAFLFWTFEIIFIK